MTSKFEHSDAASAGVEQEVAISEKVVATLDKANAALGDDVLSDIAQARMSALRAAEADKSLSVVRRWLAGVDEWIRYDLHIDNYKLAAPLAVAVVVAVLVSYNQKNSVPVLPPELLTGEVPTEELAMLEDLEFASWLAEQQQEGLL